MVLLRFWMIGWGEVLFNETWFSLARHGVEIVKGIRNGKRSKNGTEISRNHTKLIAEARTRYENPPCQVSIWTGLSATLNAHGDPMLFLCTSTSGSYCRHKICVRISLPPAAYANLQLKMNENTRSQSSRRQRMEQTHECARVGLQKVKPKAEVVQNAKQKHMQ